MIACREMRLRPVPRNLRPPWESTASEALEAQRLPPRQPDRIAGRVFRGVVQDFPAGLGTEHKTRNAHAYGLFSVGS